MSSIALTIDEVVKLGRENSSRVNILLKLETNLLEKYKRFVFTCKHKITWINGIVIVEHINKISELEFSGILDGQVVQAI